MPGEKRRERKENGVPARQSPRPSFSENLTLGGAEAMAPSEADTGWRNVAEILALANEVIVYTENAGEPTEQY